MLLTTFFIILIDVLFFHKIVPNFSHLLQDFRNIYLHQNGLEYLQPANKVHLHKIHILPATILFVHPIKSVPQQHLIDLKLTYCSFLWSEHGWNCPPGLQHYMSFYLVSLIKPFYHHLQVAKIIFGTPRVSKFLKFNCPAHISHKGFNIAFFIYRFHYHLNAITLKTSFNSKTLFYMILNHYTFYYEFVIIIFCINFKPQKIWPAIISQWL